MSKVQSGSAARVLAVLNLFRESYSLTLTDIATTLELNISSVYRTVKLLEDFNFLERLSEHGALKLGPAARSLGETASIRSRGVDTQRWLLRAAEQTGGVILLYSLRGHRYVCIERVDLHTGISSTVEIGDTMGLHAGAGKTLLAFQTEEFISDVLKSNLPRYTDFTITDPDELTGILDQIRTDGYWVSRGEITPGTVGLSLPILSEKKTVSYCLCASFEMQDYHAAIPAHIFDQLRSCASALSGLLG